MRNSFLAELAEIIRLGLNRRKTKIIGHVGRFPKRQLFLALNDTRKLFESHFRCPVTSRWSVGRKKAVPQKTLVLEYLVDYGICRFSIPQAIRQKRQGRRDLRPNQSYEILLAAESELGNDNEVARDLLKLLDVRSRIRCLIFMNRPRVKQRLYRRIEWVLAHHAHYKPRDPLLLVGISPAKNENFVDEIDFSIVRRGTITNLFPRN